MFVCFRRTGSVIGQPECHVKSSSILSVRKWTKPPITPVLKYSCTSLPPHYSIHTIYSKGISDSFFLGRMSACYSGGPIVLTFVEMNRRIVGTAFYSGLGNKSNLRIHIVSVETWLV